MCPNGHQGALAQTVAIPGEIRRPQSEEPLPGRSQSKEPTLSKRNSPPRRARGGRGAVQQAAKFSKDFNFGCSFRPLTATSSRRHQRATPHQVDKPCSVTPAGESATAERQAEYRGYIPVAGRTHATSRTTLLAQSTTSTYSTRFALVCTTRRSQSAEKINSPSSKEKARKLVSTATVEVIRSRSRTWRDRPSHQMLRPGRVPLHSATFRWAPP